MLHCQRVYTPYFPLKPPFIDDFPIFSLIFQCVHGSNGDLAISISGAVAAAPARARRLLVQAENSPVISRHVDVNMLFIIWLVVYLPLWKIWKSVGMIIPNIWKNVQCSKPPTSNGDLLFLVGGAITILKNMSSSMGRMTSHIWNGK